VFGYILEWSEGLGFSDWGSYNSKDETQCSREGGK